MTCSRALAVAAMCATAIGCNPLTGADDVDTDEDNPDPTEKPTIVEGDAPATPTINCAYPTTGNLGVGQGSIVPGDLKWQGIGPGEMAPREVSVAELFDCAGSLTINGQPVNAVMIDTSQYG